MEAKRCDRIGKTQMTSLSPLPPAPPHLSLMLLHPRHLLHHPRHPFQEESAREQARHEESEAKLAEWWRRCDSPPFSQRLRESVCVCACIFRCACVCILR
ncbi:unnamed protein product [Boreogadus saida]